MSGLFTERKDKDWTRALGNVAGPMVVDACSIYTVLKKSGSPPGAHMRLRLVKMQSVRFGLPF